MTNSEEEPPNTSPQESNNDRQFGCAPLKDYAKPFNWPIFLGLAAAYIAIHYNIDSLKLTQALKLAMTPLAGFIAIGLFDLLRMRVEPQLPLRNVDKAATWITSLASLTVLLILVHVAIPVGDIRDTLGAVSAVLLLATILLFLLARNITEFNTRHWEGNDVYPPARYPWAWLVDAIMVATLSILVAVAVGLVANLACDDHYDLGAPATLSIVTAVSYVYQVASISLFGYTYGQRLAKIRVVKATEDLRRPSLLRTGYRTFLPLAHFYAFYMLIALEGEGNISLDGGIPAFIGGAVSLLAALGLMLGSLSIVILRNIHPQGQGLLDLIARTVVLPADEVPGANN